ncbi:MAG: alpha-amylase family glycosyl hydrolase, partial [Rhodothermia bacterium]
MNRSVLFLIVISLSVSVVSCERSLPPEPIEMAAPNAVPEWAKRAIWYQVFVERFRNGDSTNDPTADDIVGSWPHRTWEEWKTTPWGHDWYAQEPWAVESGEGFYVTVQARRYGGDLQGVLDQLDYLSDLGVTALYLNPINDSPSLHKYDPQSYQHVDHNFGPDPEGDLALMKTEDPYDSANWQWSAADSLLLVLIDQVHERGMRIILDYSWNHTGETFWAFRRAIENPDSPYREWYTFRQFDDPDTPENELEYKGWFGSHELPEIVEIGAHPDHTSVPLRAFEGDLVASYKKHAFDVTRRWLDPDGDGDPSDGVDGYRLDVAGEVPLGFWRDYRQFVKDINPDAYLVGEIWWEEWPDRLADPNPWLGPVFDAVMNYRWFPPTRSFLNGAPMFGGDDPILSAVPSASMLAAYLDSLASSVPPENARVMMNTGATHDTPRLSSSLYNENPYKAGAKPSEDPSYKIDRPDVETFLRLRMLLTLQFAYVGAPHIWNGDEVGMWGADDPDDRKPMVWGDLTFDDEVVGPDGIKRKPDEVTVDTDLLTFYKRLIAARKTYSDILVYGDLSWPLVDDDLNIVVMSRRLVGRVVFVALNNGREAAEIAIVVPM